MHSIYKNKRIFIEKKKNDVSFSVACFVTPNHSCGLPAFLQCHQHGATFTDSVHCGRLTCGIQAADGSNPPQSFINLYLNACLSSNEHCMKI